MAFRWGAIRFAALAALLGSCTRNPANGERQLMLVDESTESAQGREADAQIVAELGSVDAPLLTQYVTRLGRRIASLGERPQLRWSFRVLDDPAVNAFALPGGYVYVTRGLLAYLNSEAELAAVLGHEIGHVTARHSARRTSESRIATTALGVSALLDPQLAANLELAETGFRLLTLKFGRDDEREADALGIRYLKRAGYQTTAVLRVLRMLGRVEAAGQLQSGLPLWLSTHPASRERVSRAEALVRDDGREGRRVYLRMIDGLVYGEDPRSGFFRAGVFVHPLMDLRITLPRGWLARPERSSVVAVSPAGEAALVISRSASGSARLAAQAFSDTATLHSAPVRREGRCWLREFENKSPAGETYEGLACFAQRGDRVLRLVGYGRAAVFQRHRAAVMAAIGSVAAAGGDRRSTYRIQVVDAGPVSLAEFARLYPSAVSTQTLALVNGVSASSDAVVMPQPAKRVVRASGE